jgi:hypothetical protein
LCIVETTGVAEVQDQPLDPGVVVDDVELATGCRKKAGLGIGQLEVFGMAQAVGDVAVPNGHGGDALQPCGGHRVSAREERYIVAAPDQLFGQKVNE